MTNGEFIQPTGQLKEVIEAMKELRERLRFLDFAIPNIRIENIDGGPSKILIAEWNTTRSDWAKTEVATLNTGQSYETRLKTASVDPSQHVGQYLLIRAGATVINRISNLAGVMAFFYKISPPKFPWTRPDVTIEECHMFGGSFLSPLAPGPKWQDIVFFYV